MLERASLEQHISKIMEQIKFVILAQLLFTLVLCQSDDEDGIAICPESHPTAISRGKFCCNSMEPDLWEKDECPGGN